jgi:hypothetical protein
VFVINEVKDEQFWGISRVKKCHAAGTGRRLKVRSKGDFIEPE